MGGGFWDTTNISYDDAWAVSSNLASYVSTPLRVEIHGVANSPVVVPAPITAPSLSAIDYFGGFTASASLILTDLSKAAGTVGQSLTWMESQFVSHVVNTPSIVGTLVGAAQVVNSFVHNDARGVYVNSANVIAGASAAELATFFIAMGGMGTVSSALAAGTAAAAVGFIAAYGTALMYDAAAGRITESQSDALMLAARNQIENFYRYNPFAGSQDR